MLQKASKYCAEVREKLSDIWYDEKFKWYFNSVHRNEWAPAETDWEVTELVSVDKSGNVLGFISYGIDRITDSAHSLGAINFSDNNVTFAKDLFKVITDIFTFFNYNRLEFSVVIGNPIEKTYDKLCKKYGGRVIGVRKEYTKLADHRLYDEKMYEILRKDFILHQKKTADFGCHLGEEQGCALRVTDDNQC